MLVYKAAEDFSHNFRSLACVFSNDIWSALLRLPLYPLQYWPLKVHNAEHRDSVHGRPRPQ